MLPLVAFLIAFAGADAKGADVELDTSLLKSGDVILHTSSSSQAPAIIAASGSVYSHAAIVSVEKKGVFVVEAAGTVSKTPLQSFLKRGVDGRFTVLRQRDVDDKAGAAIVAAAKKHIGKPYDLYFFKGNGSLYCSELVAVAYEAVGRGAGAWVKVSDLHVDNPVVDRLLAKRWQTHPACRSAKDLATCESLIKDTLIVTPGSLRVDARFDVVVSTYPPGLG